MYVIDLIKRILHAANITIFIYLLLNIGVVSVLVYYMFHPVSNGFHSSPISECGMWGYYGKNGLKMRKFIGEVPNHLYTDQFAPERTMEYYMKTDAINNVYGNNVYVNYLLSNKLYYSTMLGIPILVSPNTYMAQVVQEYQVGFVYDLDDPLARDHFYTYYRSIDWDEFDANCRRFCEKVARDDEVFEQKVREFFY